MRAVVGAVMPLALAIILGIVPWGISAAWGGERITDPTLPRRELKQLAPTKMYQRPSFYLTLGPLPTSGATAAGLVLLRALRGGTYAPVRVLCKWEAIPTAGGASITVDDDAVCETKQLYLRAGTYRLRLSYKYPDENGVQREGASEVASYVVAAVAAPRLVTQLLDYNKAKEGGAQFANNVEGATLCPSVGQFNVTEFPQAAVQRPTAGVVFRVYCFTEGSLTGGFPTPTGAPATPAAFTGFKLKRGWKVKDYSVVVQTVEPGHSNWEWRQTPQIGSDDPSMRMHIWANGGHELWVSVSVTIEGPDGTDPYR